MESKVY